MFAAKSAWYVTIGGWQEIAKLLAADGASDDWFGFSVALSADGMTLAVGASRESTAPNTINGAAYIFTRSGMTWTQQAKLLASDAASGDQLGYSIAISSDGNTVAVGAPAINANNGAAYVFTRSGTTWTEQAKLLASDGDFNYRFGSSIALSADGDTVAVGSIQNSVFPGRGSGAAYIFTRSGTAWTQQAKLLALDAAIGDGFGSSIAISADGDTVAVGALRESTAPNTGNGAAYIFTRSGTTWTQQTKLLAADAASGDNFGVSIALSADGNTVAVGARYEDTGPNTENGAAYVFTRSGATWTEQARLLASDRADYDGFGSSIAINAVGTVVAVGASSGDSPQVSNHGSVYVFTLTNGQWLETAELYADDRSSLDAFGVSVALDSTGTVFMVGAPQEDSGTTSNQGAVYVFYNQ